MSVGLVGTPVSSYDQHSQFAHTVAFRRDGAARSAAATRRPSPVALGKVGRRRGVTLIEMLMVLIILGLMLAAALPRFGQLRTKMRVDAAAQQMIADLRVARSEALKRNRSVGLQKTGTSTYTLQFVGNRALPQGVAFTTGSDSVRFGAFGPPSSGAASFTVGFAGQTKQVTVSASGLLAVR